MSSENPIVRRHLALAAKARAVLPDDPAPFAATLRIRTGGRERDLLLGDRAHIGGGIARIHHTDAPLARLLLETEIGEDYAIELGERVLEGTLLDRALVHFEGGRLVEVIGRRRHRLIDGVWRSDAAPRAPAFDGPRKAGRFVDIDHLDARQRAAVDAPAGPTLIIGEAGSGKTTVALWRLKRLLDASPTALRARVIVPTPGLADFASRQLARLNHPLVPVTPYADWSWRAARKTFADWPKRRSRDADPRVEDVKRHPQLLDELAHLAPRLPARPVRRADLIHLFGDSPRMIRAAAGLPRGSGEAVVEHARVQYADPTEVAWAHVDPERLATLDARLIDDGTPMQDAGSADEADVAVAFELERMAAAHQSRQALDPPRCDVLLVDEAQAFSPAELRLLGRAVRPGGALIVSGDAGQHLGPSGTFEGWDRALLDLGVPDAARHVMPTVYRSPPALAAWARRLVEPGPAVPVPSSLVSHRAWHACHLYHWVADAIERWSGGSLAVITRTLKSARRWAEVLDRAVPVRFDPSGAPMDGGGVAVLAVEHARGLEFDGVIVPDAGPGWTEARADRRALYVAATRATTRLVLATVGRFSPLLADLEAGSD